MEVKYRNTTMHLTKLKDDGCLVAFKVEAIYKKEHFEFLVDDTELWDSLFDETHANYKIAAKEIYSMLVDMYEHRDEKIPYSNEIIPGLEEQLKQQEPFDNHVDSSVLDIPVEEQPDVNHKTCDECGKLTLTYQMKWFKIRDKRGNVTEHLVCPDCAYRYEKTYKRVSVPMIRQYKQVGRNEPCPCGSGKKYKHCCITENHNKLIPSKE
jgi:preprotein translocase subunit SecA